MKHIIAQMSGSDSEPQCVLNRRQFLGGTLAAATTAAALGVLPGGAADAGAPAGRKIKLGLIGCGGRGSWIAKLFQNHGGYEFHAVADYFPETANRCGDELGVDKARRFSTLSGYKQLIESGVAAVALETPPYFMPGHARAAVAAGLHVYMAKPVAVDVPGSLQIEAASRQATRSQRCFLVDYQMPTDPANLEVSRRIRTEGFGKISQVLTVGIGNGFDDPPMAATIENRLRGLVWVNDVALGCDYIGNYDIHAIDAAIWVLGQRPVAAMGSSRIGRPDPHGDGRDVCSVVYEYADGLVHNHFGQGLKNFVPGDLSCRVHGQTGNALVNYWGKATLRSFDDSYSAEVVNLYEAGASSNIATFYKNVTEGRFENETARRAVDGVLTCILGREAAARHRRLTMEELIRENQRLEVNLTGLKT
jgi:predicted dehydrogenase